MERLKKLTPFMVMEILKASAKYKDAIHFEVGQPDLPPPPKVKERLIEAAQKELFGYTPSDGLPELKAKIAKHYKKCYGVEVKYERIIITPGSSGAFLLAYALSLDVGQSIGMSDPGYPSYKNFAYTLGIKPKFLPVDATSSYCLTPQILKDIDALQISNPANPTGNIYPDDLLKELCQSCAHKGITLISDELYHGLTYEATPQTAIAFWEDAIVVSGFSKYFCMPGLRLGWVIVPDRYIQKAQMFAQNIFLAPATLSQYGALAAFDYDYLNYVRETFKTRRDFLYKVLKRLFHIPIHPQGAFYIWADIKRDGVSFAKELLEKEHVAVTPGIDFGTNGTKTFVRFAYTQEIEKMQEGLRRIERYLASSSA